MEKRMEKRMESTMKCLGFRIGMEKNGNYYKGLGV